MGVGKEEELENNLNHASPAHYFFHSIYQNLPAIFRGAHITPRNSESDSSALRHTFDIGWDDVADLLQHCRREYSATETSPPLFFQKGDPITDPHKLYASNPHAAYLDGCSVIINHADLHHSTIAQLCDDLQHSFREKEKSGLVATVYLEKLTLCFALRIILAHVYANAYLTPACSHAVAAHADDRDVLVLQILGKKRWKVYKSVPVEYPFDKEQVGKHGNAVDSSVFEGGLCFDGDDVVLNPGDVLYLPRGYVHEATTENSSDVLSENDPSFHITVAIATHDWCLSVLLSETIRDTLDRLPKFRKALPIGPCEEYESFSLGDHSTPGYPCLKKQLDDAMNIIHDMTPSLLEDKLLKKYSIHNKHAAKHREKVLTTNQSKKRKSADGSNECVGDIAASLVTLQSIIRVSTSEERSSVVLDEGCLRGMTVREETMRVLMKILSKLKSDTRLRVKVRDLRDIIETDNGENGLTQLSMLCDFTLLSFARCCVELGALAVVPQ